jgi:hypothetical protein
MVILFRDISSVVLDEKISDQEVRSRIYQEVIPKEQLQQKVEACETLARPADYNCLDFVETRYNYTRQFSSLRSLVKEKNLTRKARLTF